MTQFAPYLRTTPQSPCVGRKSGANPNFCALLAVFFVFVELFQAWAALRRELESAMVSETEAAAGNTTRGIAVETAFVVVAAAVAAMADAAAMPEEGHSGSGFGSGGGCSVDVGSGNNGGSDNG